MGEVRSRILQFIDEDLMTKLNSIALDVLIPDNNTKMNLYIAAFEEFNVPYQELGPGTNRGAFLIDGYVFKIAFDKAGMNDNLAEFSLSQQLQPFVTKCYECNGLITVQEYVTVISKEEFNNSKEEVRQILSHLAESYLLGDVGSVTKNFMNWGYREDGSLVILDYAYIYRVVGDELICGGINPDDTFCQYPLDYDINFHKLICPKCRKEYTFHEIRRRISKEYEEKEREMIKNIAYKVTQPSQKVNNNSTTIVKENNEGENIMKNNNYDYFEENNIDEESLYEDAIEFMRKGTPVVEEEDTESYDIINDMEAVEEAANIIANASDEIIINIEIESDENIDDEEEITSLEEVVEEAINEFQTEKLIETDDEFITETVEDVEDITADEAEEAYEEAIEELTSEYHENDVMNVVEPENNNTVVDHVVTPIEEINMTTVATIETPHINTVTIETNDTVILTTPDNVDKMREMLTADLNEKYEEYDDMFGHHDSFHKIPKKKRDFN